LDSIDPKKKQISDEATEEKLAAGLGRKRCITFACGRKDTDRIEPPKRAQTVEEKKPDPPTRRCTLKFVCPTRDTATSTVKTRTRLSSPPPPGRALLASPKQVKAHRGSDSTVRTSSPKSVRKVPSANTGRRGSFASDASQSEATRFHEFASAHHEDDDWIKESTCYQRPLTVQDTLAIENGLRKLGREVEEEEDDEDEEADQIVDEDEDEDEDDDEDDEDEDDDEDVDKGAEGDDDEVEVHDKVRPSVSSGYVSDEGFQTDDEHGFAHSDDESDGDSDYDWWAPGRAAVRDNIELLRSAQRRRNSDSSIESVSGVTTVSPNMRRNRSRSRPVEIQRQPFELPDSTDFVCGTLDEDKPLEQAYINHLNQRRAAKHKPVPQDIDPTFPTSDPEIDDEEEDEVSEHDATESDHPLFHGPMDLHEEPERVPRRVIPKKRSPLVSPKRLRSPPPAKKISLHRSPPPARRARSPAPCALYRTRLSSSVPRKESKILTHIQFEDIEEDQDNTPRFNRGAIDIVRGLEKKRQRRHEKLLEKHCRKAGKSAKHPHKKHIQPGKGAERMRDLGIGLNEYRGRKCADTLATDQGDVHMLSY
jgi:hypothetical protein